ncbi:hypothetical protein [Streptomyces sp. WAC06614]|uniref:hypothetical protein n=1 Tax=Streptomyces sp. WAC06614 TaxID=2487416 RepID=UPI000F780167|nr:hypothetical protein [Streptomyces sp. WAC06614]RSS83736.1 hypothetical protein EF918_02720 [Streptomyces sp. WAC06614]
MPRRHLRLVRADTAGATAPDARPTVHLVVPPRPPEELLRLALAGADAMVIDLVGPEQGASPDVAAARAGARALLRSGRRGRRPEVWLRVPPAGTDACAETLALSAGLGVGLVVADARTVDDVEWVAARAPRAALMPVVESSAGLASSTSIARHPSVHRLALSPLAQPPAATGPVLSPAEARQWQLAIVALAAEAAGLPGPVDAPYGLHGRPAPGSGVDARVQDAATARAAGFTGHCVSDPDHVRAVRALLETREP